MEDDADIRPPEGSTVLLDVAQRTEFAAYRVIKYLAPGWEQTARVRVTRRRRRRS